MIWGKSYKELQKKREEKDTKWFAWRPVQLKDGRFCWFTRIKRTFYGSWDGSWYEYTIKEP